MNGTLFGDLDVLIERLRQLATIGPEIPVIFDNADNAPARRLAESLRLLPIGSGFTR